MRAHAADLHLLPFVTDWLLPLQTQPDESLQAFKARVERHKQEGKRANADDVRRPILGEWVRMVKRIVFSLLCLTQSVGPPPSWSAFKRPCTSQMMKLQAPSTLRLY